MRVSSRLKKGIETRAGRVSVTHCLPACSCSCSVGCDQSAEIIGDKIADPLDRQIGRRVGGSVRSTGILALPGQYGGYAVPPDLFDRGQNSRLVVDQDVMGGRITLLDVGEFLLLVDVYQHVPFDRVEDARALDLARLEYDVAV